jgi:hypothetical protein
VFEDAPCSVSKHSGLRALQLQRIETTEHPRDTEPPN